MTKYYSELSSLEEEQKELLRSTTAVLLEAGLVFPYFKTLAKYVPMPEDIMDKAMIQYHSDRNARIDFEVRILPDEEEYHCEDIGRTYQGIFVKKKVLFEGEILSLIHIYVMKDLRVNPMSFIKNRIVLRKNCQGQRRR